MSKNKILPVILIGVLIAGVFGILGSCDLFNNVLNEGVSAKDRVDLFIADVKAEKYSSLYTHFYEGKTQSYDNIKSASYWETTPFHSNLYFENITDVSDASVSGDTATITATLVAADNYSITFSLQKNGSDYYITVIDFASSYDNFDVRLIGL
jgi:hypothetical protein